MSKSQYRISHSLLLFLKKIKNLLHGIKTVGPGGFINTLKRGFLKSGAQSVQYEVEDLQSDKPMFRYATCNDLIWLMSKYPEYCREDRDSTQSSAYGLKAAGTLFCVDKVVRTKPARILEIGPGWNRHFDTHFSAEMEYWMIDDASEIGGDKTSSEKFEQSLPLRKNTHFVRGYLGGFSTQLPVNYFDLVFSISVVEHVPPEQKQNFYKDMFRVLKPGGCIAHSIDIFDETLGSVEFETILKTGFVLPAMPDLRVRVRPSEGNPTLFEDLWTVFHGYLGLNRKDKWENLTQIPGHNATIFVFCRKPG